MSEVAAPDASHPPAEGGRRHTLDALRVALVGVELTSLRVEIHASVPITTPEEAGHLSRVLRTLVDDALAHVPPGAERHLHVAMWRLEHEHHIDVALGAAPGAGEPLPALIEIQGRRSPRFAAADADARRFGARLSRPASPSPYHARVTREACAKPVDPPAGSERN